MCPCDRKPIFEDGRCDLYGPMWIYVWLIVTIIICGHFSSYVDFVFLEDHKPDEEHEAELAKVGSIVSLLTFYVFIIPLFIYIMFWIFGSGTPGYQRILAVYGYSYAIFIPASVLLIPPIEYARYAILGVSAFISLFFISKELIDAGKKYLDDGKVKLIAIIWACLQIGLCILLKFYYFD